jgi:hypothetical protein
MQPSVHLHMEVSDRGLYCGIDSSIYHLRIWQIYLTARHIHSKITLVLI